ncbi:glucan 1,3-beta-glucosidase [Corynascus novoguineensis]|uniref:Glucan 1,3-beta-glucosidase n=1 Tax=Corynascus novoguineensis TaxID=1126955 RepID=A0AAN7CV84_9PEZI|nr:glucan 1,3-beta-glucosidase [Corynascus novoguineensis]
MAWVVLRGLAVAWLGLAAAAIPPYLRSHNITRARIEVDINFGPRDPFAYMVDNTFNTHRVAPDKGSQNGPVWLHSGSFEGYMTKLRNASVPAANEWSSANDTSDYLRNVVIDAAGSYFVPNSTRVSRPNLSVSRRNLAGGSREVGGHRKAGRATNYWLTELGPLGSQPLAGTNYKFYRDVTDYGAKGDGVHDDTEAINAAIQDGNRCGLECGNTFIKGAIIYFPFIGHPIDRPIILGCETFSGIALFDTDPYIPGGNGAQWFVNQNQFFRQIRNFIFDMTKMPSRTDDAGQPLSPTGIHWQVAQAATLQNLLFKMPPDDDGRGTHVGIFMENGSGGFASDLEFQGGAIGWRAGTQQYTARNLKFRGCTQAVQMIWDWGFNWQQIDIDGGSVGFNISGKGGITNQGVGSVSFIDCKFSNIPIGILTDDGVDAPPNMVIDNLVTNNVDSIVRTSTGHVLIPSQNAVLMWATGQRYMGGEGSYETGSVAGVPFRPERLLKNGSFYARSRPQYESLSAGEFLVATAQGIKNDGTGDQTDAINSFLQGAVDQGKVAYFPAGIYQVYGTVNVPVGSRIQGSSWSQIMGTGDYFSDTENPQVMVRVGKPGESGILEIVEMLFTVKGATAGAILLEWNVHESHQGSAAMWDSHFRVGGATGSNLTVEECPKFGYNEDCIAASLLFHVTPSGSGYFENVWVWTADHDNDMNMYWEFDSTANQISVYTARGTLIESQGPSWFVGGGSEHSTLYQYQLYKAKDIYLGHIQTETPYYQPNPVGPKPFDVATTNHFPADPTFDHCDTDICRNAWALRILDSSNIYIHSAGTYSFFQDYDQTCVGTFDCQERLIQVRGSDHVVIFNIFTIGAVEAATGVAQTFVGQEDTQSGFTTEISVWLPLDGDDDYKIVYIGTEVFTTHTAQCTAPCILVLPPLSISETTISIPPYTTSLQVGSGIGTTTSMTLHPDPITTDSMGFSNVNVTSAQSTGYGFVVSPSINVPPVTVTVTGLDGKSASRTLTLPPWPRITEGPPSEWSSIGGPWVSGPVTNGTLFIPFVTPYFTEVTATGPTIITVDFPPVVSPITLSCPPSSVHSFQTPATAVTIPCPGTTTIEFACPTNELVLTIETPTTTLVKTDCTAVVGVPIPTSTSIGTTTTGTPTLPIWTEWPPGAIYPVTTSVDKPRPTGDHSVTPCKLWFFWLCFIWDDIDITGWEWNLPPGILPPGPPPINWFRLPPKWKIHGPLPPWPPVTIGRDHVPTFKSNPDEPCETRSASICSTTTSVTSIVSGGTTRTSTSISSACATILGCNVEDENTGTGVATCTRADSQRKRVATLTATPAIPTPDAVVARATSPSPSGCSPTNGPAIIYPKNPKDDSSVRRIRDKLSAMKIEVEDTHEARSDALGFTAFFWVEYLSSTDMNSLRDMVDDVQDVYHYEQWSRNVADGKAILITNHEEPQLNNRSVIFKRDEDPSEFWELSQVSAPPGAEWMHDKRIRSLNDDNSYTYKYYHHESEGEGQYVYVVEDGIWDKHPEFRGAKIEHVRQASYADDFLTKNLQHGSGVTAKIIGSRLGVAKRATAVIMDKEILSAGMVIPDDLVYEKALESLLDAADDIAKKGRSGKAVVNISWAVTTRLNPTYYAMMLKILQELDQLDTVIVAGAGNNGLNANIKGIDTYPARFLGDGRFPNMIVVGSTNRNCKRVRSSSEENWVTTYAPAGDISLPAENGGYQTGGGTSFAAPLVAGLVAYYRGLPLNEDWKRYLQKPANVKKLITWFHRRLDINDPSVLPGTNEVKPIIWNAQVFDYSCLLDRPFHGDSVCGPALPDDLETLPSTGVYVPGGQMTPTITYQPGAPSPTCTTNCGKLCTGYYWGPNPTGTPPDFIDPVNTDGCAFKTTTTRCNGSGGHTACIPVEICTVPTDFPTLTGTASPTHTGSCMASGPVTTCAMGPGGQSACITSTTCTSWATATSTTSTLPPPSPTPHNAFITIFLMELFMSTEIGGDWYREWDVFSAPIGVTIDPCWDGPIFFRSTTSATGDNPGFPPTLGPFEAEGFTCTYKGTTDKLGVLECDEVRNMWCHKVPHTHVTCDGNPIMFAAVLCRW